MRRLLLLLVLLGVQPGWAETRWHIELVGFTDNGAGQVSISPTVAVQPLEAVEGTGWLRLQEFPRSPLIYDAAIDFLESRGECSVLASCDGMGPDISFDGRWSDGAKQAGPILRATAAKPAGSLVEVSFELYSTSLDGLALFRSSFQARDGYTMGLECFDAARQPITHDGFPHTILYIRVEFDKENK